MKELVFNFFSNLGQKLVMLVLVGTAALTTGTAVSKVVNKPSEAVLGLSQDIEIHSPTTTVFPTTSITPEVIITPAVKVTPRVTPSPTPSPKPAIPLAVVTPKPTISQSNTNRCIVTLFGQLFDVTSLRASHSGGDIFKCGTDQTTLYQSKHGNSLSRMSPYAYNPNGSSNGTVTNPTGTPTPTQRLERSGGDDDREDEEHRDRYVEESEEHNEENEDHEEYDD